MTTGLAALKILHCDDEKVMHRLVSTVLHGLGIVDVETASSVDKALHILKEKGKFDLIISDWRMGDGEGVDIVKFVRSTGYAHSSTPVIMLTGNTEAHYVVRAINQGINAYLIKPFTADKLAKSIRSIIESPLPFVMAPAYRGPDRRRAEKGAPAAGERRKPRKKR